MSNVKTAIVTGAASGIGLAITEALTEDGVKVVMADINEEALISHSRRLGCQYKVTNLTLREDCKGLVDYTIKNNGRIDILVNVAGIQNVCPIEELSLIHISEPTRPY